MCLFIVRANRDALTGHFTLSALARFVVIRTLRRVNHPAPLSAVSSGGRARQRGRGFWTRMQRIRTHDELYRAAVGLRERLGVEGVIHCDCTAHDIITQVYHYP